METEKSVFQMNWLWDEFEIEAEPYSEIILSKLEYSPLDD